MFQSRSVFRTTVTIAQKRDILCVMLARNIVCALCHRCAAVQSDHLKMGVTIYTVCIVARTIISVFVVTGPSMLVV